MRFERFLAYRYLCSPRQGGFISVIAGFSFLGITLGVATLIIVMSVMNGFRQELLSKIIGMKGHLIVTQERSTLENFDEVKKLIQSTPKVTAIYPLIERQAIASHQTQARGAFVVGIRAEDLKDRAFITNHIIEGDLKGFQEKNSLIIGRKLADYLHVNVGDRLLLTSPEGTSTAFGIIPRQKGFKIAAIFDVGMNEYDRAFLFMPLETAQEFFKLPDMVTHLEVFVSDPDLAGHATERLRPQLTQLTNSTPVTVTDWQHSDSAYFKAIQVERNVMFLILTLIILIAAFNIISSLIMLVKDKTRDIAILRTMGATQLSVLKIFCLTGTTIGFVGTFMGVTLGLLFSYNIESIRRFLESLLGGELFQAEIYFLSQLPSKVDGGDVLSVVLMAMGLSFLATLYPAWKAARLDPVEALRQ